MKARIQVAVARETAKALLVEAEGRQGWIQRRWLAADGTVSAATFEKAVAGAQERREEAARQREAEAAERQFRDSFHRVPVVRESERAVAAEIVVEFAGAESGKLVWFPKSLLGGGDGVAEVPGWLIREKVAEALGGPQGGDYYSRHRFCKGERAFLVRGVEILS